MNAFCIIYDRTGHREKGLAAGCVIDIQLISVSDRVAEIVRQAKRNTVQRFGTGNNNIFLESISMQRVSGGYAGKDLVKGRFRAENRQFCATFFSELSHPTRQQ